jgi:hypothetical protein
MITNAARREYYQRNRARINERQRSYYARTRERRRERTKLSLLGLSPEVWAQMWDAQGGLCYLCGEDLDNGGDIHLDHDHSCCPDRRACALCQRGLAHANCNVAVGMARDDPAVLRKMADALEAAQRRVNERRAAQGEQISLFMRGEQDR